MHTGLKDWIASLQAIVSIIAIFVGGWWTYDNFIKERKHLPHANIEHLISHMPITPRANLLTVSVLITNSGTSNLEIKDTEVRVQQILPLKCVNMDGCVTKEIGEALQDVRRKTDKFSWPMIAQRKESNRLIRTVEPGEKEQIDLEFAIPTAVTAIKVYSFIRNSYAGQADLGWHMSTYHQLTDSKKEGAYKK